MSTHNRRTDIENRDLVSRYRAGDSFATLAAHYGTTVATIRNRLIEENEPRRSRANVGAKNGRWAGDAVSANTGRQRAARAVAEPEPCGSCQSRANPHRHHVNGDTSDNRPENLEWLCATCHTALHRAAERDGARGIYWAWAHRDQWAAEYESGLTVPAIAAAHQVGTSTVYRHLDLLGVRKSERAVA